MWEELLARQHGVVTRAQALACGFTDRVISNRTRRGQWQQLHVGVYATFSGVPPRSSLLWAIVLRAGPGAVLSHETAAELAGLLITAEDLPIHVTVPSDRRVRRIAGVVLHRSGRVDRAAHPSRLPPQTRIEDTVVDLTQSARSLERAVSWVARAVGARLTTVARLRAAFGVRSKLRWRRPLLDTLDDVDAGCHSTLELAYIRGVERPHGLPAGVRQAVRVRRGGRRYDDVEYVEYATIVELDGPPAHPVETRERDMHRDNAAVAAGKTVLRYGPVRIRSQPCTTAAEVATVLQRNGWTGLPKPCGPHCVIAETFTPDAVQNRPRSREG